ncbi:hypothetical protein F4803DRAFT_545696 [Xylaria telfairii]|nr:hypothetical protein F4803DRAFT_545696 [Xylaria telfairii]
MRAALSFLAAAFAAASPTEWIQHTTIAIEAFHEAARPSLANLTVVIPVGPAYANKEALHAVSALYILEDDGVTCIPYSAEFASGPHGNPFTFGHPARMSKNMAVVGSVVCTRN